MSVDASATGQKQAIDWKNLFNTLMVLFKARIVGLLLMGALGGAFLGARGLPRLDTLVAVIITGALAAGGSAAINQYVERESDTLMGRTKTRPLANGVIKHPRLVLAISTAMIALAVLATLPLNPVMALYLFLGAVIYVGVYTLWLKPRSVINIVIGGAAGSCAVMTGGAAVGAGSDPGVISLALLLFLWTPAHFWALAFFYKDDYAASSTPMLPVFLTARQSAWWIFVHALGTGLAALLLAVHPALGLIYLTPVSVFALLMVVHGIILIRTPERKRAIRLFVVTNIFLLVVFVTIIVASVFNQVLSI